MEPNIIKANTGISLKSKTQLLPFLILNSTITLLCKLLKEITIYLKSNRKCSDTESSQAYKFIPFQTTILGSNE